MSKKYVSLVPDKYMDGWDNVYKKQMEGKLVELPQHYAFRCSTNYYHKTT
ncbi:MAG: hypothetical protein ACTSQF_07685 [Candidatus Heimdallarchaeaceae archaeon]